jgi:hypothetical protein
MTTYLPGFSAETGFQDTGLRDIRQIFALSYCGEKESVRRNIQSRSLSQETVAVRPFALPFALNSP